MNDPAALQVGPLAQGPDDASLVRRARLGDERALETLVLRHQDVAFDAAFRVVGDEDTAADVAQDAFLKAFKGLDRFREEASFRTWLIRIVINTARSALRTRGRRRERSLESVDEPVSQEDPARIALIRTEADRVGERLAELPEKQRLAITLRVFEGMSYREIAEACGSTEGAMRVNYHMGIKRLREWLT
ncbi:MAG: sigma-70 family RNA polymerase sigma factor [Gemmatimonadota bacterium]